MMTMWSWSLVIYRLVLKQVPFGVIATTTADDVTRFLMWPTVVRFLVHVSDAAEYVSHSTECHKHWQMFFQDSCLKGCSHYVRRRTWSYDQVRRRKWSYDHVRRRKWSFVDVVVVRRGRIRHCTTSYAVWTPLNPYVYVGLVIQTMSLQGVSIALLCKPCTSYDRDVRPSVCPSVTRWYWVKTTQARITKSSPTDSPRTLVFGIKNSSRNSKGFTSSEG